MDNGKSPSNWRSLGGSTPARAAMVGKKSAEVMGAVTERAAMVPGQ